MCFDKTGNLSYAHTRTDTHTFTHIHTYTCTRVGTLTAEGLELLGVRAVTSNRFIDLVDGTLSYTCTDTYEDTHAYITHTHTQARRT